MSKTVSNSNNDLDWNKTKYSSDTPSVIYLHLSCFEGVFRILLNIYDEALSEKS